MAEVAALNEDFLDMLRALIEAEVEFVIVGAHALAVHGVPRATGDIDVLVRPSKENAGRVMNALRMFGAPTSAHGVSRSDFEMGGNVYQIGLPPRRIDLLTEISGIGFDEVWRTRVCVERSGLELSFIGREALIQNKRASGRDKDLVDVKTLEKAAG